MLPVLSSKNGIIKNVDPKFNKRDVRVMSYMLTCLDSDIEEDELNELLSYSFKQSGNVLTEDEIQSLNELLTNLNEICELEEASYSRFRRDKKVIYERYYEYLFEKRKRAWRRKTINEISDIINNDKKFVDYWNKELTRKEKDKIMGSTFYSDLVYEPVKVKRAREYMRIIKDFIEKYSPSKESHPEKTQG